MTRTLSGGRDTSVASALTFCASVCAQRRHRRALVGEHAFLLRDVELGAGAGVQPLLDGVEDARGAGDIALGGAQPVLRSQHLEIGIGDADHRGQRHHVAVEPAGDRESPPPPARRRGSCPRNRFRSWR